MKTFIQILFLSFICTSANATLIEANYSFDGTSFTLESGDDSFLYNYQVGDVLTLTFSADGDGAYWDFSNIHSAAYDGFDLGFGLAGERTMQGNYYFYYQGMLVDSSWYYSSSNEFRAGPNSLDVKNINFVDFFKIEYELTQSTAWFDLMAPFESSNNPWLIWNTLGTKDTSVPFVSGQAQAVSEPSSLALLLLSASGIAGFKLRKKYRR